MPAKQLEASVYQDSGSAVTGSSRTRASGTTRDRAPDSREGPGTRSGKRSASLDSADQSPGMGRGRKPSRDPEIDLRTLASVRGTHRGNTTDPRQWSR
jgi:hypothetical protein